LNLEVVELNQQLYLAEFHHVALDGTFVAARDMTKYVRCLSLEQKFFQIMRSEAIARLLACSSGKPDVMHDEMDEINFDTFCDLCFFLIQKTLLKFSF
jgi:hypothetical protein